MSELSHINEDGEAQMVDVSRKPATLRIAKASGYISIAPDVIKLIRAHQMKKGDVVIVAKIAGIQAAKRTSDLIPLCHPLPQTHVEIECKIEKNGIAISAISKTTGPTGVEMEALTAVSVCALTLYDMCKAADPAMEIGSIHLDEKTGGKAPYKRDV